MKRSHRNITIKKEEDRRPIDWATIDDHALVRVAADRRDFARSDVAWRELLRRYGRVIEERIQRWALNTCRHFLSAEFSEELRLALYLALLENDMRGLRQFDPNRGSFGDHLSTMFQRVAAARATRRLNTVSVDVLDRDDLDLCSFDERQVFGERLIADGQAGAQFIAESRR